MANRKDLIWRNYDYSYQTIIERVSKENMEQHIKYIGRNWDDFLKNEFVPLIHDENSIIRILKTNQYEFIGYYWLLSKQWTEDKFKIMDAIFLNSVIIDQRFQQQGFGSLVLEEVINHARSLCDTLLLAYIQKSNSISYHFFVEKNNFRTIKEDSKNWMIQLNIWIIKLNLKRN